MSSLLDELKYNFQKQDNGLVKIIMINVAVFLILSITSVILHLSQSTVYHDYILPNFAIPADLSTFIYKPWTIFTYFFSHEEILHILFNMLGLYWFGRIIHEFIGNRRLINLYILGGLAGGILYLIFYNTIPFFRQQASVSIMLGASASVFAIAAGAATLAPDYRFNLLFIGPVRIIFIVGFYIIVSFIGMKQGNAGGNIAHLGGAFLGFVYIRLLQRGTDLGKPINIIAGWIKNIGKPKMKVYSNKNKDLSHPSQSEIDAILDKISRSGYESLSKEEKQKLFKASQK
ncbi:MAG TPA: rhomboid family intramembrane serine protease [Cytophagaceae bacterium]|nr:rhomboid family intramembrane serine protease [Cytophagaceae bacterium]